MLALFLLFILLRRKKVVVKSLDELVLEVVGAGADVVYEGWHLYYSKHNKKHVILRFNKKSDVARNGETLFEDPKEAARVFIEGSGLGKAPVQSVS